MTFKKLSIKALHCGPNLHMSTVNLVNLGESLGMLIALIAVGALHLTTSPAELNVSFHLIVFCRWRWGLVAFMSRLLVERFVKKEIMFEASKT